MSSADSFRGRNPNKFTGESHAKSRQKAWNPRLWIKPCKYPLYHCTVTYLAPREKQMPKTLQQLQHLQSLPPLWRHLCCSCQGKLARKRDPLVFSEYRRQTNLKMFFAVYYFFAQRYQYKKRWWPSHTHSPRLLHILPPWPSSTQMSMWRGHAPGPSLFRFGTSHQNGIGSFFPEAHGLQPHTLTASKCPLPI